MGKGINIHALNIKDIFLPVLLLISMLVLVDFQVAGIRLGILLLFVLTLIYIYYEIASIRKGNEFPLKLRHPEDVVVWALLGWSLLSIVGLIFRNWEEGAPEYGFQVTCITLSLVYFLLKEVKDFKDWYFDLILYSGLLVMGYMLFCYLCDMQMAEILPEIMNDSGKAASYLLLPCIVSVYRYCVCRDRIRNLFYLMIAIVGFFTLLINYNISSLWIMAVTFLAIPVLMRPMAELIKRDMQLCFVFFFMMSNMSLLTNYTQLIQKEMTLSLEHSVYLDLLIAVGGVLFFRYWDKIPEEINKEKLILRKMSRGYLFVLKLVGIIFLSFVMGADRWKQLPDTVGASMVKSFAVPLVNEIRNGKNAWVICVENSGMSALLILIFTALLIGRFIKNHSSSKPLTGIFLIIALVFFMETFLFAPSINILPIYILTVVMAAFYQEEKQQVSVRKINF